MWNKPNEERLAKIPRLYETEQIPLAAKLIHLHFFLGGCDWYIAEYDGDDLFFGYAILNSDTENAEWGYISFTELKDLKAFGDVNGNSMIFVEVDCELEEYWEVRPASAIDKIRT